MPPVVVIAGLFSAPEHEEVPPTEAHEYVVLVNIGTEPVDLRGWSLTNRKQDQRHHFRYLMPRFLSNGDPWELEPGGLILLFTGRGTNGCTATAGEARQYHLYQHRSARIWQEAGDMACLYDRSGRLMSAWELGHVRRAV